MGVKSTFIIVAAFVLLVSFGTRAEAAVDSSAVVTRMDTIIKQMEALRSEFATLVASLNGTPAPQVQGAQQSSKPVFTQSLQNGETNEDIKRIQKLLATDPEIYPYGVASGFYGPKTEEGIKNLQGRFGLDQLGIIGPGTKALLELFFNAYPNEDFPSDVLKKKPQVQGASTSVPAPTPSVPSVPIVSSSGIDEITAQYDGDEARVRIYFADDTTQSFVVEGSTKIAIVDVVAAKLGKTRAQILAVIEFTNSSSKDDDDDEDEDEDEDDFDVEVEIDGDETTVSFTYDDDDYEVEVDSTDEDDVLEEVADELDEDDVDDLDEDLVDAIEDALEEALDDEDEDDKDSDEIEAITAKIANGEAEIEVEYGDGEEEEFTVEEDLESAIIEEVADELNIDEDEVEDLIEFKYEDVDEIDVEIKDGKALAFVEFEDGTTKRIRINSDDEDQIIEAIAEELDEDEDDVEEWTNFEYLD